MQRGCDSVSIVVGVEYLRESIHPCLFSPGRCHARWVLRAFPKGRDGPQLRFSASWEKPTPTSFDVAPVGTCPHGRRLFLALFSGDATLPKAVDWLPVPSSVEIAVHLANTPVFLPR